MVDFYFFDTSALIKRYVEESGSSLLSQLFANLTRNEAFIAEITRVELHSAIMRLHRENILLDKDVEEFSVLYSRHLAKGYSTIKQRSSVLQLAVTLLHKYPLRAADAIQLASAVVAQNKIWDYADATFTFLSSDKRLLQAAISEGMQIRDPNDETPS